MRNEKLQEEKPQARTKEKLGKKARKGQDLGASGLDVDDCCSSLFKFYVLAFHTC